MKSEGGPPGVSLGLVAILGLAVLAIAVVVVSNAPWGWWSQSVLVAAHPIPANSVIGAADVVERRALAPPEGAVCAAAAAIGRLTIVWLDRGEVLRSGELLRLPAGDQRWVPLEVPIPAAGAPPPGETVQLVDPLAVADASEEGVPAVALAVDGTYLVVAVPLEAAGLIADVVESGETLLVVRSPGGAATPEPARCD